MALKNFSSFLFFLFNWSFYFFNFSVFSDGCFLYRCWYFSLRPRISSSIFLTVFPGFILGDIDLWGCLRGDLFWFIFVFNSMICFSLTNNVCYNSLFFLISNSKSYLILLSLSDVYGSSPMFGIILVRALPTDIF